MSEDNQSKVPSHNVYTVIDIEGREKGRWVEIGAAWPNKDGEGFTLELDAVPVNGRLVIRKRKPKSEAT